MSLKLKTVESWIGLIYAKSYVVTDVMKNETNVFEKRKKKKPPSADEGCVVWLKALDSNGKWTLRFLFFLPNSLSAIRVCSLK